MSIPLRTLLFAVCLLTFGSAPRLWAQAQVEVPPRPSPPNDAGMTRQQRHDAYRKWIIEVKTWQDGLTPAQKAELQREQDASDKEAREQSERLQRLPLPADGYRWQDVAAKRHLPPEVMARLERDKLAYGPSVKQIFTPYLGGPVFVTSDSVLNAYQALFEDTFRQLELRRAQTLRGHLEEVLAAFHKLADENLFPAERFAAAWRHAQLVVGPAIVVMGGSADQFDPELRGEIESEAENIRRADAVSLPGWLAPADPGSLAAIDYRRCKPLSLYSGDTGLENYFRAVRWLQMVPLRASRDRELVAAVLFGMAMSDAKLEGYFGQLSRFIGPPDDPSPCEAWEAYPSKSYPRKGNQFREFDQAWARKSWAAGLTREGYYQVNSDLRAKDARPEDFSGISFRVIPAFRLPDAPLLQRLDGQGISPSGLDIAAWLGSDFAAQRLSLARRQVLTPAAPANPFVPPDFTLSRFYFDALRELFTPPPPEAPAFLRGEAWRAKTCETALGAWVQEHHGYALQAKLSMVTFGVSLRPPGFVEPNPGFYAAMSRLVDRAHDAFADGGIFAAEGPPAQDSLEDRWRNLRDTLLTLAAVTDKQLRDQPLTKEEEGVLKDYGETIGEIMGYFAMAADQPQDDAPKWAEVNFDPRTNRSLAVALGRPRALYVLYPWKGMDVLCTGAVTTYYEYQARDRLTDAEWKALLDSKDAPAPPAWAP